MCIDAADWHYNGDFPDGLPPENGATHIALFFAWILIHNLEGRVHRQRGVTGPLEIRTRRQTAREYLMTRCRGRLCRRDLSKSGLAFTLWYYETSEKGGNGQYYYDYSDTFKDYPTFYHVEDTWENYDRLAPMISTRYREWAEITHPPALEPATPAGTP